MKERILQALYILANEPEKSPHLEFLLSAKIEGLYTVMKITERAKVLLTTLLHNYSRFNVSTIDSFFQRVVRSFAREIGLHAGYRLETDQSMALKEVQSALISSASEKPELLRWLDKFTDALIETGRNWDFRKELSKVESEVLKEKFDQISGSMEGQLEDKVLLTEYERNLSRVIGQFEQSLSRAGREILDEIAAAGLSVNDFSKGKSGVYGFLAKLASYDGSEWEAIATAKTPRKVAEGLEGWYPKKASEEVKAQIDELCDRFLTGALQEVLAFIERGFETYITAVRIREQFYTYGIFHDLLLELQEFRQTRDLLLIRDNTVLLNSIIDNNDAPFIYEKVGTWYHHFLIDEFQDTSVFQWRNFRPLVENSLSQGNFSMIVGDVKQSIYRWRGGDWRLLLNEVEEEFGAEGVEKHSLTENYRSEEKVIQFNNAFFKGMAEAIQIFFDNHLESAGHLEVDDALDNVIGNAYADALQNFPGTKAGGGGAVSVSCWDRQQHPEFVREKLISSVLELFEKGYSGGDIGILVRDNRQAQEIASILLEAAAIHPDKNFDFVSPGSLSIKQSRIARILIATMRFLMDPEDAIIRAELKQEFVKGPSSLDDDFFAKDLDEVLPENFMESIPELLRLGLYELAEVLPVTLRVEEKLNASDRSFFQGFLDMIRAFSERNNPTLPHFLSWWETDGHKQTLGVPEGLDAMQIMTIHKSKGLAFEAVIVPFCDWDFLPKALNMPLLWCQTAGTPFEELAFVPVRYHKSLAFSMFFREYYEEMLHMLLDGYNLLYVAFTRAKSSLTIFSKLPRSGNPKRAKPTGASGLVLIAVDDLVGKGMMEEELEEGIRTYRMGEVGLRKREKSREMSQDMQTMGYSSGHWREVVSIRMHKRSGKDDAGLSGFYREVMGKAFALLEEVDSDSVNKVADALCREGWVGADEKAKLIAEIRRILGLPGVSKLFQSKGKLLSGQAVLLPGGKIKAPDKVRIVENEVIIANFNFGTEELPFQLNQMKGLIKTFRQMGYEEVNGCIIYGHYLLNKVVEVEA